MRDDVRFSPNNHGPKKMIISRGVIAFDIETMPAEV
jgi:hypothetical protein